MNPFPSVVSRLWTHIFCTSLVKPPGSTDTGCFIKSVVYACCRLRGSVELQVEPGCAGGILMDAVCSCKTKTLPYTLAGVVFSLLLLSSWNTFITLQ